MATTERRGDRARALSSDIRRKLGRDIREARVAAGVSQRAAAASVGMSHSTLGRIERGVLMSVTVDQLSLACGAVGLRFSGKAYPDGDPIRDAGQTRLLARFEARLPLGTPFRRESPIPIPGDSRGIDGTAILDRRPTGVEAERTWLTSRRSSGARTKAASRLTGHPISREGSPRGRSRCLRSP